jgi:hypothetical protein
MKRLLVLWLGGLVCLLSLTTCSKDEVEAAIAQAVGEYQGALEWNGGHIISTRPANYTLTRSAKGGNVLNARVHLNISQDWIEDWEVKFFAGGGLIMDRQNLQVYVPAENRSYNQGDQEAIGKIIGDSLILDGERFFTTSTPRTFCKYRAKKKI